MGVYDSYWYNLFFLLRKHGIHQTLLLPLGRNCGLKAHFDPRTAEGPEYFITLTVKLTLFLTILYTKEWCLSGSFLMKLI